MNKIAILAKNVGRFVSNNSPVILTSVAVAGVVTTAVFAVKGTPQAMEKIEEARLTKADELTRFEVVKAAYLCYVPAAAVGAATIACIIGATKISTKRNAALMSMYSLTETAFREYQDKVVETMGAKADKKVRDEVAQDRIKANPVANREVIITSGGDVLCYDSLSGRYFESDMQTIRKAQNDINQLVINDMMGSLNQFYELIGLPSTKLGEELGWTTDNMLEVNFSTALTEDGKPCISLDYRRDPIKGYYLPFHS